MAKLKLKVNDITSALPDDAPQIAAMAMAHSKDAGVPVRINYEKVSIAVNNAVLNETCFVRRNKVNPRLIDGFLLLGHQVPIYSLDSIVYSILFYIKPEFRSFSLAKSIITTAKDYARIVKLPLVFDLFTQKDAEKKKKLLMYLGFTEVGSLYVFDPKA